MKFTGHKLSRNGFTIVEIMVAMAVFSLMIAAMVSLQLFGLRVNKAASTKMLETAAARHAMDLVRDQVHNGNTVYVGTSNGTNFLMITNGVRQEGNAIQVFSGTNASAYYLFYLNTNANQLAAYFGNGTNGVYRTLADNVTNRIVFDAEDFQGNVLTNNQDNRIIRMTLQFFQFEYASGRRGNAYNHYQVQMRATQRLLN